MILKHSLYSLLFFMVIATAQQKNEFLEREFWKANPSLETVKQKIEAGNDPTQLNKHAFDAVSWALIEKTDNETIKYLLTLEGNDVNKLTHDGRTYIFWAAYKDNLDMMKYLLSKGAKTDIIDDHGYSLLNFAAVTGQKNPKLYDFLIENGANPVTEKNHDEATSLLLLMPHIKDFKMVKYFTKKGLKIEATDKHGNGAFNYAASKGNKEMMAALIKKGLPYKTHNKNGGNAFIMASEGGRKGYNSLEFFKYLEGLGVTPKVINKQGVSPLHNVAYGNKDVATITYFIDKGLDVNQADEDGNTPLLNASSRNTLEVIKLLSEKTKDINHANKKGETVLIKAMKNTPEVVAFLIDKGADTKVKDKNGNNLVYHAMQSYNQKKVDDFDEKLQLLKDNGIPVDATQENGDTLYHMAIDSNSLPLLERISNYKIYIDINAKNKKGMTPLQQAVMIAKNDNIIKFLLEKGADKTVKTDFEETIFDLAKENEALKQTDISFLK